MCIVGSIAKIPIDPVIETSEAYILSPAIAIQYPPEAATLPIEIISGFSVDLNSINCSRISSEAKALPPGESILRTNALTDSSF